MFEDMLKGNSGDSSKQDQKSIHEVKRKKNGKRGEGKRRRRVP